MIRIHHPFLLGQIEKLRTIKGFTWTITSPLDKIAEKKKNEKKHRARAKTYLKLYIFGWRISSRIYFFILVFTCNTII